MRSDRQFPAWLVRRTYFKRVGRWLKHKPRTGATADEGAESAGSSNVLQFPAAPDRSPWLPNPPRRDVRSA